MGPPSCCSPNSTPPEDKTSVAITPMSSPSLRQSLPELCRRGIRSSSASTWNRPHLPQQSRVGAAVGPPALADAQPQRRNQGEPDRPGVPLADRRLRGCAEDAYYARRELNVSLATRTSGTGEKQLSPSSAAHPTRSSGPVLRDTGGTTRRMISGLGGLRRAYAQRRVMGSGQRPMARHRPGRLVAGRAPS